MAGGNLTKIAVTYENGQIFQHFGHCETFKIYDVDGENIKSEEIVSAIGSGHGALASFLKRKGIQALICGGIGGGARTALGEAGIRLFPGVTGNADENVKALITGKLIFNPDTVCSHHDEGHDCSGSCAEHRCGEDRHGCAGSN